MILNGEMKKLIYTILLGCGIAACNGNDREYDASGIFEAKTVIVSSEISGRLERLAIEEGDVVEKGQIVGNVDTMQLHWLRLQAEKGERAVNSRIPDVEKQLNVTREQLKKATIERDRVARLLKGGAATEKQMDDANTQVEVITKMLAAQTNQLNTAVAGARDEGDVYGLKIEQVKDQLRRCQIVNPISGTVLMKYTEENELTAPAKALYKVGNLENLFLRVYVESGQLARLKVGQDVEVYAQCGAREYKQYPGKITWIASEAEFTPKTIQTRDERENLVYAVKISVKNDGFLKIGMYADVKFGGTGE